MAARGVDVLCIGFLIYCSFCIKKVLYSGVDGISLTITGSYNELNDISLIALAYASQKKEFAVSFRKKSLICLLLLLYGDRERCPGPDIASFLNTKGFAVFHQNIRGLHGKVDIISDILLYSKIDIFSLSETFITQTDSFNVEIQGYTFESKTRQSVSPVALVLTLSIVYRTQEE